MDKKDVEMSLGEGGFSVMPVYPPRKSITFEIDADGATYKKVKSDVDKICADYKDCEVYIKVKKLAPTRETETSNDEWDED